MIANRIFRRRTATIVGLIAGLSMLTACGNSPTQGQGVRSFTAAYEELRKDGKDAPAAATGAAPTTAAETQNAIARTLKANPGPLMVAVLEENETTAVLTVIGQNGPYLTWTTADRQSLILKRGVLTGTRGLGFDLMSSDADASIDLITSRRSGTVERVYRHIDGQNQEVPMTLSCTIAPAGSDTVALSTGASFATTRMKESCSNDEIKVSNLYWVTGSGAIPQSKQWISAEMGYLATQVLRN